MNLLASVCAGTMVAAGLSAASPAVAQVIGGPALSTPKGLSLRVFEVVRVADVIRGDADEARRPYAAAPDEVLPEEDDEALLAPEDIPALLREQGFSPLGPVFRRGSVYTVAVLDENGEDGRLIVDAHTGEPIRFIPAMRMDSRLSEELDRMYGPRDAPPAAFVRVPQDAPYRIAPAPRTADHVPQLHRSAPPKRIAKPAGAKPARSAAIKPPAVKPGPAKKLAEPNPGVRVEAKAEAKPETKPREAKSHETKPRAADIELKPTGPMPPVQPME